MMHLTGDEIFELAQLTEEYQPYSILNLQQMEHLKTCNSCYGKFCAVRAVMDATSESGYMVLSDIYGLNKEDRKIPPRKRALAVVQIIQKKIEKSSSAVIRQIKQDGAAFQFTPALAAAVRGSGGTGSKIFKAEDVDDERTIIIFDAEKRELMLQLNRVSLKSENIKVYICFCDSEIIEMDLEEKGRYLKGLLWNIPDNDFQIRIECMD